MHIKTMAVAAMVTFLTVGQLAKCEEVKLNLDWNGVALKQAFPVTGGVPIARGVLKDASAVQVLLDGKAIPLQTQALAWWPDKSVKWLLLDFQTPVGAKEVTLQYGTDVKPASAAKGISAATASDKSVTVDTGAVKFTVKSDGCGFIDDLSYNGQKVFESAGKRLNFMDAIHTASPADYHPMDRYIRDGQADPSQVIINSVTLENAGPLHAVVLIDGKYKYKLVGSTITGTDVKGDCPFRVRIHAYAGQSFLKIEHFFYYEGDGDHDFVKALGLKVPLPAGGSKIRYIKAGEPIPVAGPISGIYQQTPDAYQVWNSDGKSVSVTNNGQRFEGVLDVTAGKVGVAVGMKNPWQNAANSLQADLNGNELGIYFWPPESAPLDFRRHARERSVGESGGPIDKNSDKPMAFMPEGKPTEWPNYRLASKGVGKSHYATVYFHAPDMPAQDVLGVYQLVSHRPLLWAPPHHYAASLAMGRYREFVPGEHADIEETLDKPVKFWMFSQERFRWYGFWTFGNVCSCFNEYAQTGRWDQDFGRWGWANGDHVGRLAYALMLQSVRKCQRADFEFAENYLYAIHDCASTHTESYPHHYGTEYNYVKGATHRHDAWPWSELYLGARGAHPVGAKMLYYLTGEGHARDICEEVATLAIKNPHGGEGDGPLGINAQAFIYKWETTGDEQWKNKLKEEIDKSELLKKATSGWDVMLSAAFGIKDGLEEYMDLTGDMSMKDMAASFADRAMPSIMKNHWTWGGYYRVYASAYNITGDQKYRQAIEEMLPVLVKNYRNSVAYKIPEAQWPGQAGGPKVFVDANIIRDIPFALYSLHSTPATTQEAK